MTESPAKLLDLAMGQAEGLWPGLSEIMRRIPSTICRCCGDCCVLLPQMSLVEACRLVYRLRAMPRETSLGLNIKMVRYFFLNAARTMGCPFLDSQGCLVYEDRPFGCRAYGLWSKETYGRQVEGALAAQQKVKQAWAGLGITLPEKVVNHRIPYCTHVRPTEPLEAGDLILEEVREEVWALDRSIGPTANEFNQTYFNDLSYLFVTVLFGREMALKQKVGVVREFLASGHSPTLDALVEQAAGKRFFSPQIQE